jgi:hypothetical protein
MVFISPPSPLAKRISLLGAMTNHVVAAAALSVSNPGRSQVESAAMRPWWALWENPARKELPRKQEN